MEETIVSVVAPSRLHFGLFSFDGGAGRSYGGAGVMISPPQLKLTLEPAREFRATGPSNERVGEFARRWSRALGRQDLPSCRVDVVQLPQEHTGLGVGTQLGLSVATGLHQFCGLPALGAEQLAALVGRGERSAVGTHGFQHGGLIVERGKDAADAVSPLWRRVALSTEWRFVLACPTRVTGLSGSVEREAFAQLPPVPLDVTDRLSRLAIDELAPAAEQADFDRFSRATYEFNWLAGACFAARQGGPYNGQEIAQLVADLRSLGVEGVGQSSWGPTVFALTPSFSAAQRVVDALRRRYAPADLELQIAAPDNQGAQVRSAVSSDATEA